MAAPLLEIDGVSKAFRGLVAVNAVSFTVPEGEIVGLIGPNGAGKTTLFNLIAGVFRPSQGRLRFKGRRIDGLRPDQVCRAGIGRTFQLVKPLKGLSVEENVMVGAFLHGRDPGRARAKTAEILETFALAAKRGHLAASLTLPERKRLEVARALATEPELLLLDEVMAGLRPTEADEMIAIFRRLNAETGLTILLIEHVMRAVMALSRHVVVLNSGRLIAEGAPEAIVRDPLVLECYLGEEALG